MTAINREFFGTKEKPVLLFLHGFLSSGASFNYQTSYFEKFCDCFAPDMPNFGNAEKTEKAYKIDDYVDWLINFINGKGIKKPIVVAHSFGGRVAVKAAATYPDLFSALILTGAAGIKPRFSLKKKIKKAYYKTIKRFMSQTRKEKFFSPDYRVLSPVM
ncbi:MAG: alpha/beta hydrolase, partial [Clostridia bacterium]|nr:alpha/beta hydrolase [Clostridia bacterium]